jgi:hypothetical protein
LVYHNFDNFSLRACLANTFLDLFWTKYSFAKHGPKKIKKFLLYKNCIFNYKKEEKKLAWFLEKYMCWFSFVSFGIYTKFVKLFKDLTNILITLKF